MEEKLEYNEYGYLKNGVHSVTADEFITFFCDNGNRKEYKKAIINIFDFAKAHRYACDNWRLLYYETIQS